MTHTHARKMEVALKLTENASLSEVVTNCYNLKFHGSGEKETPCMTVRGLQRLLMLLGGKVAAQYREIREIVESVFTRYTAGDTSLRHGSEHVSNCHSFKIQGSRGHPGHSCVRYRKHADANTQQSQQSSTHSFPAPPSRTVPRTDHGSRPEIDRKCEPARHAK